MFDFSLGPVSIYFLESEAPRTCLKRYPSMLNKREDPKTNVPQETL